MVNMQAKNDSSHTNHEYISWCVFCFVPAHSVDEDNVQVILNLSQHCDEKVLYLMLAGSKNLNIDTAAEYIYGYTSKGKVIERTVPVLLNISWFFGVLLWARLHKFNSQLPYV